MEVLVPAVSVPFYCGLITVERIEERDSGMLAKAPGSGGDYGGTYGWDSGDSPRPEVLARLGGGDLSTGHV